MYMNIKVTGGGTQEQLADALFHLGASILHASDDELETTNNWENDILLTTFTIGPEEEEEKFYKHEEEFNLMTDSACYVDEAGNKYNYGDFMDFAYHSEQLARRMFEDTRGGHPLDTRHNLVGTGEFYITKDNEVFQKTN